jgi:hypothetical protein
MTTASGRCHLHPDRAGVAVCVECRRVVCRECSTQFEGVNRCAACLRARAAAAPVNRVRPEWSVVNVVLALLSVGAVYLLARWATKALQDL